MKISSATMVAKGPSIKNLDSWTVGQGQTPPPLQRRIGIEELIDPSRYALPMRTR